ncbi:type II toxin-antitoxin system HipA family toxin [Methylicorpusculum oleiharenae]|uniref:type II toxin-antitoxin system HipA family toxin n=1 Tax=Methylicorpusculum oleiharenae TaxID=1338687 RepID=UPI00135A3D94|nr:type II toxin-antitoxin system HipA family toxin [Methylicorpusculum oleiharenae]
MNDGLRVYVQNQPAGFLLKESSEFIFNYLDADSDYFVSLTMPVRNKSYAHPRLHPIFEMHLPEGYLLSIIKKHFTKLTATDDFGLLRLLSPSIRGRVHYPGESSALTVPLHLDELLHSQLDDLFDELVSRFALQSALSGVQPKVLAKVVDKASLKLNDYIVKAWGPDYPQLALNEYFCMQVLKHAGVDVPEFYLSDDDALFVMKRFDLTDQGECIGFEDMCVLQGKQRDDKYVGSYEQIAKTIKLFCSPVNKMRSLQQFFKMVVLNNCLQNGDAHLKNFGLLYDDLSSIRLAPAYDVVSTTVYLKQDIAALTLLGSKRWWSQAYLLRFAVESCGLTAKIAHRLLDECRVALGEVRHLVNRRLLDEPIADKRKVLEHLSVLMGQSLAANR